MPEWNAYKCIHGAHRRLVAEVMDADSDKEYAPVGVVHRHVGAEAGAGSISLYTGARRTGEKAPPATFWLTVSGGMHHSLYF